MDRLARAAEVEIAVKPHGSISVQMIPDLIGILSHAKPAVCCSPVIEPGAGKGQQIIGSHRGVTRDVNQESRVLIVGGAERIGLNGREVVVAAPNGVDVGFFKGVGSNTRDAFRQNEVIILLSFLALPEATVLECSDAFREQEPLGCHIGQGTVSDGGDALGNITIGIRIERSRCGADEAAVLNQELAVGSGIFAAERGQGLAIRERIDA